MRLTVAGKSITVSAKDAIGKGGEADVYDLHDGTALKVFKLPNDPDYANDPVAQEGARQRIEEQQRKLPAFPGGGYLPSVVTPMELAYNGTKKIAGYTMEYLKGCEVLLRYGDRRFREQGGVDPNDVVFIFAELAAAVATLHNRGVVIGDFNDLNVLVGQIVATNQGQKRGLVYLIDADSFQFGGFDCHTFTPRFLDPLYSDPLRLHLSKRLDEESDWYAYSTMFFQSLFYVSPYGGVHRPKTGVKLQHDARVLKRITVFNPEVIYPKPALPYTFLPDELLDYFHRVFEKDERGRFPAELLHQINWTTCTNCGTVHARTVCPACATYVKKEPVVIRGNVKAQRVFSTEGQVLCVVYQGGKLRYLYHEQGEFIREGRKRVSTGPLHPGLRYRIAGDRTLVAQRTKLFTFPGPMTADVDSYGHLPVFDANSKGCYWVDQGGQLQMVNLGTVRVFGQHIGDVLPSRTLFWVGEKFGFGFYRAGELTRAFVFDDKGLNDQVKLTDFRGELVDTTCVFSDTYAWFLATLQEKGKLRNHVYVIDRQGRRLAHRIVDQTEEDWLAAGIRGRFAAGHSLYVPTHEGIVRIDEDQGLEYPTQTFPDTEPFVDEDSYLLAGDGGIYVVSTNEITLLTIK